MHPVRPSPRKLSPCPRFSYCLLPISYFLLPIAYSLLPIAYSLFPIAYFLLPIAYFLPATTAQTALISTAVSSAYSGPGTVKPSTREPQT